MVRRKKEIAPLSKADRDFFQIFYEEHKNFLYHAVTAYKVTAAERDDLIQEAILRLMKNISVLRQLTRCKTAYYIVITVRTAYIDMLRLQQNSTAFPLDDDAVWKSLYSCALTERNEFNIPERMAVRQLKENLPERDWMVLVGKSIMGYTHEELGELLGMNPANVRMVLSRAKAKARKLLRDEDWIGGDEYE